MSGSVRTKALLWVPMAVSAVLMLFLALGYLVVAILGIPPTLGFVLHVRLFGALPLVVGFLFLLWLFRYRKPADILVSTYVTFSKVRGVSLEKPLGRTEPLVIRGPHRYVRHPLYLGVVLLVLSFWVLLDYTLLLFSAILLLLWFNFVVAPFEEKELRAMFGDHYGQYSREVPRMIPLTKWRKK
jgi:protein-S-isoprenylcysteine O-methyltransferase Ste14